MSASGADASAPPRDDQRPDLHEASAKDALAVWMTRRIRWAQHVGTALAAAKVAGGFADHIEQAMQDAATEPRGPFTALPESAIDDEGAASLEDVARDVLVALEYGNRGEALSWTDRYVLGNQLAGALKREAQTAEADA